MMTDEIPRCKVRYVVNPETGDRWPVAFRLECERTFFDPRTGEDEGLFEMMVRLEKSGYLMSYQKNTGISNSMSLNDLKNLLAVILWLVIAMFIWRYR